MFNRSFKENFWILYSLWKVYKYYYYYYYLTNFFNREGCPDENHYQIEGLNKWELDFIGSMPNELLLNVINAAGNYIILYYIN